MALGLLPVLAPPAFAQSNAAPPPPGDVQSGFDAPLPGRSSPTTPGQGGAGLEGGFSQDFSVPSGAQSEAETPPAERIWSLAGFARLDGAYAYAHDAPPPIPPGQTDWRGLSKLRTTLELEFSLEMGPNWKAFVSGQAFRDFVYQLRGEAHYTQQVLDAYQQEGEIREAWVRGTPVPSLDIKVGRQIVVWGKSDYIRVTDVLNPLDMREPGLTSLEDLRLPVTMAKVSYYTGPWSLTGIAIPEIRFNKNPVPGSDYFPYPSLPPEDKPTNGDGNTEWAASLSGIFSGWDLAFYWADVFNPDPYLADADNNLLNGLQPVQRHARVHMAGTAGNVALGNWLLKAELAQFRGLRFANVPDRTFARTDGMVGVEYSGFRDTTLGLEASDRHLLDHVPALDQYPDFQAEDVNQYVLTYQGTFLHDKLTAVGVLTAYGAKAEQGTLQRYQLTYELASALNLTGGVLIYTPGQGDNFILAAARNNDRAFFELKWSF
ncbi:MAG TPA: DUF1302 family protein [bacterium]|nr:DUF1302 family protein [bacterium]